MRALKYILTALVLTVCSTGCNWFGHETPEVRDSWSKVMILYSAGFNSLSYNLAEDIEDLMEGYLPGEKDDNAVIVVSHLAKENSSYAIATRPQIIRVYKDKKSRPVRDTIKTLMDTELLTLPDVMEQALTFIRDSFKSEHYGLVLSSHGTGWLPSGYYSRSGNSSSFWSSRKQSASMPLPAGAVPYVEEVLPGPAVKTFGQEIQQPTMSSSTLSYELDIKDMAASIPMHLDYILFDACLMGGVEVAYELKDVCDFMGFSQAEVLADGLDYYKLAHRLLSSSRPDPKGVCEDYFARYNSPSASDPYATVSLIDCTRLDGLAEVCRDLFAAHRAEIKSLAPSSVQGYFRFNKHWFYDLEDILVKAGVSASEKARLDAALTACVLYNESTSRFISFDIATHCGFSMYLPSHGSDYLDNYYKTLAWNRATGLVE